METVICSCFKEKPKTALKKSDAAFYPAINKILTIFLTIPVGGVCWKGHFQHLGALIKL